MSAGRLGANQLCRSRNAAIAPNRGTCGTRMAARSSRARHTVPRTAAWMRHWRRNDPALEPREAFPLAALRHQISSASRWRPPAAPAVPLGRNRMSTRNKSRRRSRHQQCNHAPPELCKKFVIAEAAANIHAIGFTVLAVDENQIDIGRDVQLTAAQLSHADHQQVLRCSVGAVGTPMTAAVHAPPRRRQLEPQLRERQSRRNDFRQFGAAGLRRAPSVSQHTPAQAPQRYPPDTFAPRHRVPTP